MPGAQSFIGSISLIGSNSANSSIDFASSL